MRQHRDEQQPQHQRAEGVARRKDRKGIRSSAPAARRVRFGVVVPRDGISRSQIACEHRRDEARATHRNHRQLRQPPISANAAATMPGNRRTEPVAGEQNHDRETAPSRPVPRR